MQIASCNYGDLMVRDRIVVGLLDRALSEKLQLDASLTMETAVTAARQSLKGCTSSNQW